MLCKGYEQLMVDYLSGELPQAKTTMLLTHIGNCPGCARLFEEYKTIIAESKRIDIPFPEIGAWDKKLSEISEIRRPYRIRIFKPAVVVLGLFLLIISLLFVRITDNGKSRVAINKTGNNGYGAVLATLPYSETSILENIEDIDEESASEILEIVFDIPIFPLYEQ